MIEAAEISVYDRMCWPTAQLEAALERGTHQRELRAYLGAAEYAALRSLALRAARTRPNPALPRVYVLPGIMGTQLGFARPAGQPADLLWLDPSDIVQGRLAQLRWDGQLAPSAQVTPSAHSRLQTLGVIPYSYLPLALRLRAAGFEVVLYEYDWRADLHVQGAQLAACLQADAAPRLALLGHSMGGLLARSALAQLAGTSTDQRISAVCGLGTPQGGAFAAVQALRASYPFVCRLAAIDERHDAMALSREVFDGFLSIYQLIPAVNGRLDLLDARSWPRRGAQPVAALLAAARGFGARLAAADARFVSIIGTGQRTVTGIARRGEQFRYEISAAGDGTVAAARATLPGARNHYVRCEHSELPRNERVAAALIGLLRTGRTRVLPQRSIARPGRSLYTSDVALQRRFARKVDWHALSSAARRRYLRQLSAPPPEYRPPRS